ncbi:ABC transporter ATP-binding protein [Lipingzhangella sp. LS1_29]|uniref:ABC transporter ATP-binding protein n=1 Tax=Lipingzhangella rawalii TaxID=2055835 RepID=A0ABU2HB64_9ACTN|nr:ABC transporter ATP-binding protein [Lipingzhangella rawalii]MDS1272572.1 ABC transporter ATP-binding protein [Lipingzhangella rawalii]
MSTVIETEHLTKHYGARRGISQISLSVHSGEVFGFLGPNGAGKTTTIRLLLDLLRPSSGHLRVLGRDPRSAGAAVRQRVGYLPGDYQPGRQERGSELLRYLAEARGGVTRRRIEELTERFELDPSQRLGAMSRGNRQKLGIVQAFMHDPELLILDEPTTGLDPLMQQNFLSLVREVRACGQTVFLSSHLLAEVRQIADRIGIVRAGHVVAVDEVAALRERAVRRVEVHFDAPVPPEHFANLDGVRDVRVEGTLVRCVLDGRPDALIKAAAEFTVVEFVSFEPDLEEIFLAYYTDEGNDPVPEPTD